MNVSWFIHKSTHTGQETFFPRERILTRVGRIQELKGELSAEQLKEIFSPNVNSFQIPLEDFVSLHLVTKLAVTAYTSVFPNKKELKFDDVFAIYVVDHLMRLSGIYLEDAKQVIRMQAVSCGGAYLVIAAEDASEGTAKKAAFAAREAGVSFCRFSTRDQLGKYLGKTDRAVAAVIDKGFADRLIQLLQDGFEVTKGE